MSQPAALPIAEAGEATLRSRSGRPFQISSGLWALPALIFLMAFFIIPLAANIARSLPAEDMFRFYAVLFTDPYYLGVVWQTVKVSAITTVACLLIGYPVSYFMVRFAGRWNSLIVFLLIAPLLTSIIMRTFGWTVLFARKGLVNTMLLGADLIEKPENMVNTEMMVYVGLIHVLVPFMVLSITSVLQGVNPSLEESAQILGASKLRTFLTVTFPLSIDGIATGCILVFVLTNGSFLTMLLLGGGKVTTLSLLIYQQFTLTQNIGFAAAMGNVLLLFALIGMTIQLRFLRRKGVK
ncbi:ABC transporter permease [Neorhizobium alkalisoli]|uniref:Putative spermidine/putrescine transport system permease protein n=1 Tax=Neorhizobium alkalisoli TaxID=528178 RepID=A0A561Q7V4_9HYPH|nr:ABC transporter permease [Neorhizobium alkalisoli]TWF46435.1 putative spermidine/putrescine transport system permease protein [Neorhizobium alkalisoli]